jgi:hypothetical protein
MGVGIEHGELAVLREQRLVLVRPVQVDEEAPERLQQREGAGRAIDELLVPRAEDPLHHERVPLAGFEASVLEEGVDLVEVRVELEDRLDRTEALAGADEVVVGPLAEDELERTDDHRLAGAGLAGDADEAGPELPGEVVDEGEVLDF